MSASTPPVATTDWTDEALAALTAADRMRTLLPVTPLSPVLVGVDGRDVRLFSSNDYLGLAQHPTVRAAAAKAAAERGMGTRGSPLICGYTDEHQALEGELSQLKGAEATLVFPTGHAANTGLLGALGGPVVEIFSDRLNHASIVDGCRLARSQVRIYRHNDVDHLESLLSRSQAARRIVVTDAVFSMDGDVAPLAEIVELKQRHDFILVVDEAHSTLVLGPNGAGLATQLGVSDAVDFSVGTLSKAFGALGGFVSCSERRRSWLLNTARSYIFSTALPIVAVAAARAALDLAQRDPGLRETLWERVRQLAAVLGCPPTTPIFPLLLGEESRAVEAGRALLSAGFHVTAIRPPTVPQGTSRLRVALSAAHTADDVDALVGALNELEVLP
ncbi:MAG: 8-amino-7-oxononanoate synthase [Myxococcota bacterium]|jgi:8-amino-7-oxononanoate synthase